MTAIPAKGTFCQQANFSQTKMDMQKKTSLETIKISITVIVSTSENLFRNDDLILSLKGGKFFSKLPNSTLRPV